MSTKKKDPVARKVGFVGRPNSIELPPKRRYAIFRNPQVAENVDQVSGIVAEGRFFRFRKPLEVVEGREGSYYTHESETLGMLGYGATRQESWNMFISMFEGNWDEIAQSEDSDLTRGAKELKRLMLRLVESVDQVR